MTKWLQVVMVLCCWLMIAGEGGAAEETNSDAPSFYEQIDLDQLGRIAVHADGRVKSFGSFARSMMQFVSGSRVVNGQPPMIMYLDMMLRPDEFEKLPVIFVRNKPMRQQIAAAQLQAVADNVEARWGVRPEQSEAIPELQERLEKAQREMDRFVKTGLVAPNVLAEPRVAATLEGMRQDLLRTARFVEELETAQFAMNPDLLRQSLLVIPPPGGGFEDPWLTFEDLAASLHAGNLLSSVNLELKLNLLQQWDALQQAWVIGDAPAVNAAAAELVRLLPQVNEELYPGEGSRTGWPWSLDEANWKWITSGAIAAIFLAGAIVSLSRRRTLLGVACLTGGLGWIAFLAATRTLGTANPLSLESWYFATRNMTWVWVFFALSLVPLLLSIVFRWKAAHWIGLAMFLVAFGFQTAALLIRWYVSDRWPNSNMFEAVTTAAWFGAVSAILLEIGVWRSPLRSMFALGSAVASMVALMCAFFMPVGLNPNISNMMPVLHDVWLYIHTNIIIFSYCLIFMAAVSAVLYLLYRAAGAFGDFGGPDSYARMGGAGSLIQTTPDGQTYITRAGTSFGQVLDGTTMVLMELSFILLWAGLVMGAIWADHSWGRPWGWDPKEVFALNTFIVFAVLVHVRLKIRDKGFWTAVIALIGAAVMMFNWIAINFVVVGLHSYA